ncbi:MAG: hypothetical protein JRH07_17125 [Deltaproteobacteria bacterium]|nr:hypothetical protein [Deltaproteobacteria bacterium]MBW2123545.1 hypothetical protein [Deltaproteobacteria bacterium]
MPFFCFHCHREISLDGKVSRQDQCPHCGSDLHCCVNCLFYDEYAHNRCREPQAESVSDREKGNFCEYFRFRPSTAGPAQYDGKTEAEARWEALFRKGGK